MFLLVRHSIPQKNHMNSRQLLEVVTRYRDPPENKKLSYRCQLNRATRLEVSQDHRIWYHSIC